MRIEMHKIAAAFLITLCLASSAFAQGTAKSKAVLGSEINTDFPDNTSGAITPAITRGSLDDFLASWQQAPQVNAQVGVTYTFLASDYGQLVTFNNSGAVAVVLPQATGSFSPWSTFVYNKGAGPVTITPATSTINGASMLIVPQNGFVLIVSDSVNYQIWGLSGSTISCDLFPTLTGNVTTPGASCVTTIANNAVTNAMLATVSGDTIKCNNTTPTTNPIDCTPGQVGAILCVPQRSVFITGTSLTYTPPTCNGVTATWLEIDVQGGGGGGAGGGSTGNAGTAGNNSVFGGLTAGGGGAAPFSAGLLGGAGGTCSGLLGAQQNFPGSAGAPVRTTTAGSDIGGEGGISFYGGHGIGGATSAAGGAAPLNSGGGGGGGGGSGMASTNAGPGGGAGCHIKSLLTSNVSPITYSVGLLAAGGGAGTSGFAGGAGAAGLIDIIAHWQ